MIDRDLLSILVCPECKTALTLDEERGVLKCGKCRRAYPIRDGIPVLLKEEAVVEDAG